MTAITFATPVSNRPALRRTISKLISRDDTVFANGGFDSRELTVFVREDAHTVKSQIHGLARSIMCAIGTNDLEYSVN